MSSEPGVVAVIAAVRAAGDSGGPPGTWLQLAETMLRHLRGEQRWRDASLADRAATADAVADLLPRALVLLGEEVSAQVATELADSLSELLEELAEDEEVPAPLRHVAACRLVVEAIDAAIDHTALVGWLRAAGSLRIEPGRIYPLCSTNTDPRALLPGQVSSDPMRLQDARIDCTPRLRLGGDAAATYRFVLDWDAHDHLALVASKGRLRIAACQPNVELSEFDIEVDADPLPGSEEPTFRNRGAWSQAAQTAVVRRQLQLAAEQQADVVIFPEYTVGPAQRDALVADLTHTPGRPSLVVGGSCEVCRCDVPHDESGCVPINEAVLWTADGARTLQKVLPAVMNGHVERIDPSGSEVRVFVSRRWTFCVLICRDAMSPDVLHQLQELRVSLLLVPAMSPKTTTLAQRVSALTGQTQAFTALAVAPASWGPDLDDDRFHAAFSAPYANMVGPLVGPEAPDRPLKGTGVWLFDSQEQELTWSPTEVLAEDIDNK